MISLDPAALIRFFHTCPPEVIGLFSFVFAIGCLFALNRYFGAIGLLTYALIAVIVANLQVLKGAHYSFSDQPIPLGPLWFSSTFLAIDMMVEQYGTHAARQAVQLSFFALLLMGGLMLLTLGVRPLEAAFDLSHPRFNQAHRAMEVLFLPTPALFSASLIAYLISQYTDITIYQTIRHWTQQRALWLRTFLSSAVAALLDTVIFSVLAWVIFARHPVDFKTLLSSYIFGTYGFRLLMSLLHIPLMYLARHPRCRPLRNNHDPLSLSPF